MVLSPNADHAACARSSILSCGLAASLVLLCACGDRKEATAMHTRVAQAEVIPAQSIDPGVGGRPSGERAPGDALRYAYYGLPQVDALSEAPTVLYNSSYAAGYDFGTKLPAWVAYRVFPGAATGAPDRGTIAPTADPRIAAAGVNADYGKNAPIMPWYLAPAGMLSSLYGEAAAECRLSSSVVPVPTGTAMEAWDQLTALEPGYAQAYDEVWVVNGTIPGEQKSSAGSTLPGAFFKIQTSIQRGRSAVQAFVVPVVTSAGRGSSNQPLDLSTYLVSVQEIEERTGLRFYTDFHDVEGDTRERMLSLRADGVWSGERPEGAPTVSR